MPPDWYSDTDPRAMRVWIEIQRRMDPGEKLALTLHNTGMLFRMQETGIRAQYPEAGDREVFLRAAARRLGREVVANAYGWCPDEAACV